MTTWNESATGLIQRAMRASLPFLVLLASLLGMIAPAANAAAPALQAVVTGPEEGCASALQADCKVCEPQFPAAWGAKQSSAKPLPAAANLGRIALPAAIVGAAWTPSAATGAGPPAYLIFHRFLL